MVEIKIELLVDCENFTIANTTKFTAYAIHIMRNRFIKEKKFIFSPPQVELEGIETED